MQTSPAKHLSAWRQVCANACHHSPQVILAQESQVSIVDIEFKVICVAVEGDDLALWIWCHALEQNSLVVLQALGFILLLNFAGELHLHHVGKGRQSDTNRNILPYIASLITGFQSTW